MFVLFLVLFIIYGLFIHSTEDRYESEIIVPREECLQLQSSYNAGGNRWNLRFYNACGKKVYALVCVEERPGKFKLHKSSIRIPEYGYFDIFTYEGAPVSAEWRSGPGFPGTPGECGKKPSS